MNQNNKIKILVVDDEEIIRTGCAKILEMENHDVDQAENGIIALEKIRSNKYDLILLDLKMPDMGGMELLENLEKIDQDVVSIIMTAYATIETAVDAIKKGAYDYLPKPFMPEDMITKVNRGLEKRRLSLEAKSLREERDQNLLACSTEKTRTRIIIDSMKEGLIATNKDGLVALVNPAAKKLLRLKDKNVIGEPYEILFGADKSKETSSEIVNASKTSRVELTTKQGRVLQTHTTPIMDMNDECIGSVTVLIDVTKEKQIENMKSDFIRMVSHELKAPIGAIEGYLNLIIEGLVDGQPEKQKDIIRKSRDKAESLIELVNDLLDLSRSDSKVSKLIEPVDLGKVLRETVEFYQNQADEKNIHFGYEIDSKEAVLHGHRDDLSRLFANLVSNAIKYTPEKGQVSVQLMQSDSQITIEVKDSGIGIPEEDLQKIFSDFYRCSNAIKKKISGTGLGLSIARKITEEHHGYIEIESQENVGSTFRVIFPLMEKFNLS